MGPHAVDKFLDNPWLRIGFHAWNINWEIIWLCLDGHIPGNVT